MLHTTYYCLLVNGTTGESLSLTVGERKSVLEAWLKESTGRYACTLVNIHSVSPVLCYIIYSFMYVNVCMLVYSVQVDCNCSCWL